MIIYDDMYKNSITMYISLCLCVFFALKSVYYTLCTHYIELLYIFFGLHVRSGCALMKRLLNLRYKIKSDIFMFKISIIGIF